LGSLVGVTGAVGSGKSALACVFTGLYPYSGSVKVAGAELAELSSYAREELISYAAQDAFLFSTTIAENVAFGEASPDLERVQQSLYLAALTEDLQLFPQGTNTVVGERGVRASGGQRQRIALARALYPNHPILVLDDPFSAVDIGTERRMIERLKQQMGTHTIFIFSHRLGAFADADYVLVLDHGRLAQQGTHQQLLAQDGIYQRIYQAQVWMESGHYAE
jgi:ABC-type multidrug transport system fused ATPase/permease subunit